MYRYLCVSPPVSSLMKRRLAPVLQVQCCLSLVPGMHHLAVFCCGGGTLPFAELAAFLAASSVRGISLLLDNPEELDRAGVAADVLRTAVAAAAEHLPAIGLVLFGNRTATTPSPPTELQQQTVSSSMGTPVPAAVFNGATEPAPMAGAGATERRRRLHSAVLGAAQDLLGGEVDASAPLMTAGTEMLPMLDPSLSLPNALDLSSMCLISLPLYISP